jgi:hypothetical protein
VELLVVSHNWPLGDRRVQGAGELRGQPSGGTSGGAAVFHNTELLYDDAIARR